MYFASDLSIYVPLQSGWLWVFTPVKGNVIVSGGVYPPPPPPWFYVYFYETHYLDLRVVVIDIALLLVFMVVIPAWRRRRPRARLWGFISATIGLAFGLAIVGVGPFAMGVTEVLLAIGGFALVLYVVSLAVFVLRPHAKIG